MNNEELEEQGRALKAQQAQMEVQQTELEAQADGLVKLGYTQSLPVAFVLPPELTGGKSG